jgi:hypothetical protein
MAGSRAPRQPIWLITNPNDARMGVLTLGPGSDEEILPVFSFEEEAETFLWLGAAEMGWRARRAAAGELISLLYGACGEVKKVALDPLPVANGEMVFDLLCWSREDFLRCCVGGSSAPGHEPDLLKSLDER